LLKPGPHNLITDVEGVAVGNATCEKTKSGVTVLRCTGSFVAAADLRGGAPATREIDVLNVENLVGRADAIVLSGGSVFGLAAADGAAQYLSKKNIGLRLTENSPAIPIVPAASLHDLGNDGDKDWGDNSPYPLLGAQACENAGANFELGSVGAGTGAMAGLAKGGLGSSSIVLENGVSVGALAAVNPVGSVYLSDGETFCAWAHEIDDEFGGGKPPAQKEPPSPFPAGARLPRPSGPRENTTLAIVATSADLSGVEAKRVAMMAHDGLARAIRPAHTIFDGDIVFTVATATTPWPQDQTTPRALEVAAIGSAAADCLARAVARGVYEANR
jgi:L-aminopeptidase/D-esterase-like protein